MIEAKTPTIATEADATSSEGKPEDAKQKVETMSELIRTLTSDSEPVKSVNPLVIAPINEVKREESSPATSVVVHADDYSAGVVAGCPHRYSEITSYNHGCRRQASAGWNTGTNFYSHCSARSTFYRQYSGDLSQYCLCYSSFCFTVTWFQCKKVDCSKTMV